MTGSIPAAWPPQTTRLRVGALTLDLRYRRVAHAGGESELTQRCFDLAQLFLAEPGVLHTREDIFRRVWPGVVVEDANLTTSIWMLRKALGDESRHWLRTIAKRGYVFDPPVPVEVVVDISPIELSAPVETAAPRAPLRRRARWFAAAALACCAVAAAQWHARAPAPLRVLLVAAGPAATAPRAGPNGCWSPGSTGNCSWRRRCAYSRRATPGPTTARAKRRCCCRSTCRPIPRRAGVSVPVFAAKRPCPTSSSPRRLSA
jgi:DNA-binding winged helix-turn-helix (wHTH) protein